MCITFLIIGTSLINDFKFFSLNKSIKSVVLTFTTAILLQMLYLIDEMYTSAVTIDALCRQQCRKQQYLQTKHP